MSADSKKSDGNEIFEVEGVTSTESSGSPTDSEVPAAPSTSFKVGSKEFTSAEEAAKYLDQLEDEKIAAENYSKGLKDSFVNQVKNNGVVDDADPYKELEDKFFNDPAKTLSEVKEAATAEALEIFRRENADNEAKKAVWAKFYSDNPQFVGKEEVVEAMVNKYSADPEWGKLSMAEGLKRVGDKLKQYVGNTTVLESKNAVVTGAGGYGSGVKKSVENKPLDFATQIRQHQRRN